MLVLVHHSGTHHSSHTNKIVKYVIIIYCSASHNAYDSSISITPIKYAREVQMSNTVFLIVVIRCRLVCANIVYLYRMYA